LLLIYVKVSCCDIDAKVSKVLLHHVSVQIEIIVLVESLFLQILVKQRLKQGLIQGIGAESTDKRSYGEPDVSLAQNVGGLVPDDAVHYHREEKLAYT